MILRKSQLHLPQHKIGLIEFQTLHLFCRAEMLSSLLLYKIGLNLIYYDICVHVCMLLLLSVICYTVYTILHLKEVFTYYKIQMT